MKTKQTITIYIVRILLIMLTLSLLWFIFSNATADGEASSEQSYSVTITVQEVVGAIDPDSPIATATGEDFDILHACVRDAAHLLQYLALGAAAFGTYLSFANREKWGFAYIPPCFLFLTAATDEYMQTLTAGRAAEFSDLAVDCTGALIGIAFAFFVYGIVLLIAHRRRKACHGRS